MKRLLLVLVAVLAINFSVMADGAPRKGTIGIQTAVGVATNTGLAPGGALGAKFFITDAIAVRASLGFSSSTTSGGGGGTEFDLGAGFEYHFGGKGGVSPYAGAELGYSIGSPAGGGNATNVFAVNGVFGAEYFFSSNFSLAGELMLGYASSTTGPFTSSAFATGAALFILTWYLN
jgi:Outer membrane protein beta-barrel domain